MPFNKPLESIVEGDLLVLVTNRSPSEGKTVEYKAQLPDHGHENAREFLADVSSFANAAGGYLIYGMEEQVGWVERSETQRFRSRRGLNLENRTEK